MLTDVSEVITTTALIMEALSIFETSVNFYTILHSCFHYLALNVLTGAATSPTLVSGV